mmetsp:Transcript_38320/g.90881  ORF Transcript_38320/g.90881 Transcript_38320/m.90881 type:complete len:225 (+) Transcript_38320:1891-2565(+)
MDCTRSCRYSPCFSPESAFCVLTTSFFRTITTSSMLRLSTSSSASSSVLARMSRFGEESARRISMMESCMTSSCFSFSSFSLSSTINFTLLSLWLMSSWQKHWQAAWTAVGAWLRCVSVTAHSYVTAVDLDCIRAIMIFMHFPFCFGSDLATLRTRSRMATCKMSPCSAMLSKLARSQSMAFSGAWAVSMTSAFRRADMSCSCCRKFSTISGASGIMCSPLGSL